MAILDYPFTDLFHGAEFDFGLVSNSWAFRSPISHRCKRSVCLATRGVRLPEGAHKRACGPLA